VSGTEAAIVISRRTLQRIAIVLGSVAVVLIVAVAAFLAGRGSAGPQALAPATVPPAIGLCSEQLSYGADGNASPLFCAKGQLNVLAWKYFAADHPRVMSLGPNASPQDVEHAICADMSKSTGPIETSTYQLAAAYYGWSFGVVPTDVLTNGGCA
jgi:hypothetical protein